jgi:2-amino-4-hydroxy-6-hydroxymethyldihydropteridine diphosphokinase
VRAVVGIGANLGDRSATIHAAVQALRATARVLAVSRTYESAPVGGPPQPDYLNAAVLLEWELEPPTLLEALHGIEAHFGRARDERWGARTLDLDILWLEGRVVDDARLVVPHPRLHERAFALVPMLEVAPGAIDPRSGAPFVLPADAHRRVRIHTTSS